MPELASKHRTLRAADQGLATAPFGASAPDIKGRRAWPRPLARRGPWRGLRQLSPLRDQQGRWLRGSRWTPLRTAPGAHAPFAGLRKQAPGGKSAREGQRHRGTRSVPRPDQDRADGARCLPRCARPPLNRAHCPCREGGGASRWGQSMSQRAHQSIGHGTKGSKRVFW